MRMSALEWTLFLAIVATTLVWMDAVPSDLLRRVGAILLAWSLGSTLLVGTFGACMALARRHATAPRTVHQG